MSFFSAALDGGTEVMVFVYSFAVRLTSFIETYYSAKCLGISKIFVSRRSVEQAEEL